MAPVSALPPGGLPGPLSSFIGRHRELDEVAASISAPSARLVTLTGVGGCGKTRLAIALAQRLLSTGTFEHGARFVDLSGLDTPSLLPQTIAAALGLPEARDRSHLSTLIDFLQHKPLLLILDNCEHLLQACADVTGTLLSACPDLRILATSREPLGLPAEKVWQLPPLAVPGVDPQLSLEQLSKSEAIQLFVERAHAALPDFNLSEENAASVAQICRRLDGIPLALELTAARVRMLDLEQIAARLDNSLQLLTHGSPEAAPRHQTMRAALDWSYALLSPQEQTLFRRLAVFSGTFTLEAVEQTCTTAARLDTVDRPPELHPSGALDLLSDLVDKSTVLIAGREPRLPVRYRLLEPIRQYALEKLRESGEEAPTRDRHLAYFLQLAEALEPELKGEKQLPWLKRLEKDHENLRAALAWSARDPAHSLTALRLAQALHHFWDRRGYWSEGRRWLQQTIAGYDVHREDPPAQGDVFLARAIVAEGWLAYAQGDYGGTRQYLERAIDLAQAHADWATLAVGQGLQAQLTSYAGNAAEAVRLSALAVASARRSPQPWTLAWTAYIHGIILYRQDEAAARLALDESLRLFRQVGDRRSIAVHLNTLGYMSANSGRLDTARAQFQEALDIGNELADRNLQMTELSNLANLARLQGDLTAAAGLFEQVLTQARELGRKHLIAAALEGLGHIYIAQGDLDTAHRLLRESVQLCQDIGFQDGVALALSGLASIAARQGQGAPAARLLGAVHAFLTLRATRQDADGQAALDQDLAAVQSVMAPRQFDSAFASGRTLTLEQAIQQLFALEQAPAQKIKSSAPAGEILYLQALGPMQVQRGEQSLTTWPYAKVKELLFYLASHPARAKAQLGLALWPEASSAQLRNSLGTSLYHLRRVLGDAHWILFEEDQYRFNRSLPYRFDVEVFESGLTQAGRSRAQAPEQSLTLLQEAIRLYHGDFLEDCLEGEWFLLRREDLRRKYLAALLDVGALHFAQGRYDRAADTYRRAIEKESVLEAAHRELMRCYARLGERGRALLQYQTLQRIMRTEFGSAPAPESLALYERLKQGADV